MAIHANEEVQQRTYGPCSLSEQCHAYVTYMAGDLRTIEPFVAYCHSHFSTLLFEGEFRSSRNGMPSFLSDVHSL